MLNFNGAGEQRDYEPRQAATPEIQQDPVEKFRERLEEVGLSPKVIMPDGEIHRFDIEKRGDKAGWYVLYAGDIYGGTIGNWKDQTKENWCSKSRGTMTHKDQVELDRMIEQASKARAEKKATDEAAACQKAAADLNNAPPLIGNGNPYLIKKGVNSHGLSVSKSGDLLVPMFDENRAVWNYETIPHGGGFKRGLTGGRRIGIFFDIPGQTGNNNLYLCEGYSTGATIHEQTGATVVCAFNAGNMPHVAKFIKNLYPAHSITVAADNDQWPNVKGEIKNGGLKSAQEAGAFLNAPVVCPEFSPEAIVEWRKQTGDQRKGPTDFNDLVALEGGQAAFNQLADVAPMMKIEPFFSGPRGNFFAESKNGTDEQQFIFSRPGDRKPGGLRVGVIGYEGGEGGSGKTRIWFQIGASIAYGHDFTGGAFNFYETGPFYMVAGEDSRDIMAEISTMIRIRAKENGFEIPEKRQGNFEFRCVDGGKGGPCLFKRDAGRNLIETEAFHGLYEDCKEVRPVVLVLDSQSIIIGMGEESNEDAGMISGKLKVFLKYCKAIIIIAHTNKNSTTAKTTASSWDKAWPSALSVEALRGSSGLVFNGRFLKMTTKVPHRFNEDLGAMESDRLIACSIPKANGSAEVYDPFYFKQRLYSWTNNQGTKSYSVLWDYFKPDMTEAERKAQEDAVAEAAEQTRRANIILFVIRERVELAIKENNPPGRKGSPGNLNSIAEYISECPLKLDLPPTMNRNKAIRELEKLFKDGQMFDKDTFKIIFSKNGVAHFKVQKPSQNQEKLKGFEDEKQHP